MNKRILAGLAPVVLLAGCGGAADPSVTIDAVRQTEQVQLQSIESGDLRGIVRLYAEDARLVRPDGSVLEGRAAIEADYEQLLTDPNFALAIEPTDGWAGDGSDLAVVTSYVTFTTSDSETGEPVSMPMDSTATWHRLDGGTWEIVSAYNVMRPAEPEAAPAAE